MFKEAPLIVRKETLLSTEKRKRETKRKQALSLGLFRQRIVCSEGQKNQKCNNTGNVGRLH